MDANHVLEMLREGRTEELRTEAWNEYHDDCEAYLKKSRSRSQTDAAIRNLAKTPMPNKNVARIWQNLNHTYVFCMHSIVSLDYSLKRPSDENKLVFDYVYQMFEDVRRDHEITDEIDWALMRMKATTNWQNKHERMLLRGKDGNGFGWNQNELAVPVYEMEQILTLLGGEFRAYFCDRGTTSRGVSYPWLFMESDDVHAIILTAPPKDEY